MTMADLDTVLERLRPFVQDNLHLQEAADTLTLIEALDRVRALADKLAPYPTGKFIAQDIYEAMGVEG